MVEEKIDGKIRLNQPAGHLESNESLIDAIIRETDEETAWQFEPTALIGIYRWQHPTKQITFIRYCFTGNVSHHNEQQTLDDDIEQALWLTQQQIKDRHADCRSPLVLNCLNDYINGHRYPLTLLHN